MTIKTTTVEFEQFADIDFEHPATFYVRTAMYYVYIHTKEREVAQSFVDKEYGKGKYTIRAAKLQQPKNKFEGHKISAKG